MLFLRAIALSWEGMLETFFHKNLPAGFGNLYFGIGIIFISQWNFCRVSLVLKMQHLWSVFNFFLFKSVIKTVCSHTKRDGADNIKVVPVG